jgi:hypothetical protein
MRGLVLLFAACLLISLTPTVAASQPLPTGTGVQDNCVVVYDFPDAGYAICKGRADCPLGLYERRTTFLGTKESCLL